MSKAVCVMVFTTDNKPEEIVSAIRNSYDVIDDNASLWLWVRGQYTNGSLSGDSWKTAFCLEKDGWQVRNEIAFSCKVADPAPENRLKRGYEKLMHLVRGQDYYYDRTMGNSRNINLLKNKSGLVVTRSGVVGSKYVSQIESSVFLSAEEKEAALLALGNVSKRINLGEISDFRLVLRGSQKSTKSVMEKVDKYGFYIRTTKAHSVLLDDFWTSFVFDKNTFIPRGVLLSILRLSCPLDGTVLDIFPSIMVSKTVVDAGRTYIAKGITDYSITKEENRLFEFSSVDDQKITCEIENGCNQTRESD